MSKAISISTPCPGLIALQKSICASLVGARIDRVGRSQSSILMIKLGPITRRLGVQEVGRTLHQWELIVELANWRFLKGKAVTVSSQDSTERMDAILPDFENKEIKAVNMTTAGNLSIWLDDEYMFATRPSQLKGRQLSLWTLYYRDLWNLAFEVRGGFTFEYQPLRRPR